MTIPRREQREDLARALRAYRIGAGVNQATIARTLGVSQSQVSRWESGRDRPGPNNIEMIRSLVGREAERQRRALIRQVRMTRAHCLLFDRHFTVAAASPALLQSDGPLDRFGWLFVPAANPQFDELAARYHALVARQGDRLIGIDVNIPFFHAGNAWMCRMTIALHRAGWDVLGLAETSFEPDIECLEAFSFKPVQLSL